METVAEVFVVTNEDMDLQTPVQSPESYHLRPHEDKENFHPLPDIHGTNHDKACALLEANCAMPRPDEGGERHVCETCRKHFVSKEKLEEHTQDKHAERAFSCSTCRKTFSRSHHLKIHMRSHTGDRYTWYTLNIPSVYPYKKLNFPCEVLFHHFMHIRIRIHPQS